MELLTPILNNELLESSPHLIQSEKYNPKNNLGKLPLRLILKKNKHDHLVGSQKLGFNVNTIKLWEKYGFELCKKYLVNSNIINEKLINSSWVKDNLKENLEVEYVNKFLGLLALEIWYRIFVTKEMNPDTKLSA